MTPGREALIRECWRQVRSGGMDTLRRRGFVSAAPAVDVRPDVPPLDRLMTGLARPTYHFRLLWDGPRWAVECEGLIVDAGSDE